MLGAQQLKTETANEAAAVSSKNHNDYLPQIGLLVAVCVITIICYSPILFNFFAGDDYVHLTWLHRVIKDLSTKVISDPELIWRNFHSSWLDGTTTKFYRPLISVFMVSDYELWGLNGLGFHITNLLFHLASTIFIFFTAKNLEEIAGDKNETAKPSTFRTLRWPLAAATLFALYPLHPEAVSWITGRVDSVVTAYCMGALYFYIRFSRSGNLAFMALSLVSSALGLMSKEMAITLPAVFMLYELIYSVPEKYKTLLAKASNFMAGSSSQPGSPSKTEETALSGEPSNAAVPDPMAIVQQARPIAAASAGNAEQFSTLIAINSLSPLVQTFPFWILLAVYFWVRIISLQTMVGGYDNSLTFIPDMKAFIHGWQHAIYMLLVPINKALIGSHHILSKVWPAGIIISILAVIANALSDLRNSKHILFLGGWLVLCLAPVYKLFNIADDLQGSRLAYLATVPLCMLLACGLLQCRKLDKSALWINGNNVLMAIMLSLSAFLLWTNNMPWKHAGEENNAIRASLQKLYDKIPGDPEVLFLGLPDQIDGAYTCRNSLDGMTKYPQISRDIQHCLMVNAFEPILPFGFLKESIAENKDKIFVYRWDEQAKDFKKIDIESKGAQTATQTWTAARLKECISVPEQKFKPTLNWSSDGVVTIARDGSKPQYVDLDLGTDSCWDTEFVEMNVTLEQPATPGAAADLLYSNDMYPDFELRRRASSYFVEGQKEQHLLFGMGGLPEWSLGGHTHKFRLMLPQCEKFSISSISILPRRYAMAKLIIPNSGYFGTKGYLHLGPTQKEQKLEADVSQVNGAAKFSVEITRTNLLFEEQNTQRSSRVAKSCDVYDAPKKEVVLKYSDFLNSPGIYEIRVFPLSKDSTICGAASDHLVISVDP